MPILPTSFNVMPIRVPYKECLSSIVPYACAQSHFPCTMATIGLNASVGIPGTVEQPGFTRHCVYMGHVHQQPTECDFMCQVLNKIAPAPRGDIAAGPALRCPT